MKHADDRELLSIAYGIAATSPDPSTQNGAVLFEPDGHVYGATLACNAFPANVAYTAERWDRPTKYVYIEHAERAAIYQAARYGIQTSGLGMACPWAPCPECARAIISAGIRVLVTHRQAHDRTPEDWRVSVDIGLSMLAEAGVGIRFYDGEIGDGRSVLHSGERWAP